jgi:hypothetical protein
MKNNMRNKNQRERERERTQVIVKSGNKAKTKRNEQRTNFDKAHKNSHI